MNTKPETHEIKPVQIELSPGINRIFALQQAAQQQVNIYFQRCAKFVAQDLKAKSSKSGI